MLTFWHYYFSPVGLPWYQGNIYGNILASAILAIGAYFLIIKKILICNQPWCFRVGHHKVQGTHYKTCPKHTTEKDHLVLQHKHHSEYPDQHKFLKGDGYER